jgi:hypothetical protein
MAIAKVVDDWRSLPGDLGRTVVPARHNPASQHRSSPPAQVDRSPLDERGDEGGCQQ